MSYKFNKLAQRFSLMWFVFGVCLFGHAAAQAEGVLPKLVMHTEEFPPMHYRTPEGEMTGWVLDMWHHILTQAGLPEEQHNISMVPWARGYTLAMTQPNYAVFTASQTPERMDKFHWIGPYVEGRSSIFGPAELDDIQDLSFFNDKVIGVVRADVSSNTMKKIGLGNTLMEQTEAKNIVGLMANGRLKYWAYSEPQAKEMLAVVGLEQRIRPLYLIRHSVGYLVLNKNSDPDLVAALQAAFAAFRHSDAYQEMVVSRYPGLK